MSRAKADSPDFVVRGGRATVSLKWLRSNLTGMRLLVAALLSVLGVTAGTLAAVQESWKIPAAVTLPPEEGQEVPDSGRLAVIEHRLNEQKGAVQDVRAEQLRQTELLHELKGGMEILIRKELGE